MVLDCCNVSGVLMSASATTKSVLIGNTANMKPTYSATVACRKEKAEFSTKQTNMSCQDEVKRWVTADFVNVSRRVSVKDVKCYSTFCSDANLDYPTDSASLNNSEELHIRNFQPQTRVRQQQSLNFMADIENWLTSGISCCTNTEDPNEIKR